MKYLLELTMGVTEGISDMADLNCAGDTGTVKETESARRRNERKMNRRRTKFISLVERDIGLVVTQIPSEVRYLFKYKVIQCRIDDNIGFTMNE